MEKKTKAWPQIRDEAVMRYEARAGVFSSANTVALLSALDWVKEQIEHDAIERTKKEIGNYLTNLVGQELNSTVHNRSWHEGKNAMRQALLNFLSPNPEKGDII